MNLKVIKTKAQHKKALSDLEELMIQNPEQGSRESDRLEVLALLIEKYEAENIEIGLPDPIEAIKFRMEQLKLTNKDIAPYIGSASKVSEVLHRKRPLSMSMIRALHQHLGIGYEVLMKDPGASVNEENIDWRRYPLKEMCERNVWANQPSFSEVQTYAEEYMTVFINESSQLWQPTLRKDRSTRSGRTMNNYALDVWRLLVLRKAEEIKIVKKFAPKNFEEISSETAYLSQFDDGPKLAQEFLAKQGIRLVFEKHFSHTYLDGAALKTASGDPIIGLTLRFDRLDNFWFVLLHELVHVGKHLYETDTNNYYDDLESKIELNAIETEADVIALETLIPPRIWNAQVNKIKNKDDIIRMAIDIKRSPAIIAGQLQRHRDDYRTFSRMRGNGMLRKVFM